jgi:hypothetical protein
MITSKPYELPEYLKPAMTNDELTARILEMSVIFQRLRPFFNEEWGFDYDWDWKGNKKDDKQEAKDAQETH